MSHLGSITGHELVFGPAAVEVVNSFGTNTLLVSAMGLVLKLASDTALPMGIRSLAAVMACAIASVIVIHSCRHRRGLEEIGSPAHGGGRPERARGRPARSGRRRPAPEGRLAWPAGGGRYAGASPVQGMVRNWTPREDVRPHRPGGAVSSAPRRTAR